MGDIGDFAILPITPRGAGDSAAAIDCALTGAALDDCHEDHPEDRADDHPRLPSRVRIHPRMCFRLPSLR